MSDDDIGMFHRHNMVVYLVIGACVIILVVVGLIAYRGMNSDEAAEEKADQLLTQLQDAGVQRLPSRDQIVRVLGNDGGSVCDDPSHGLRKATLFAMITNGAAGPGERPVITDSRLLRGQLAVMSVYCPDELESVQEFIDDLKTGDVVRN